MHLTGWVVTGTESNVNVSFIELMTHHTRAIQILVPKYSPPIVIIDTEVMIDVLEQERRLMRVSFEEGSRQYNRIRLTA